jgi:hypothetical protein
MVIVKFRGNLSQQGRFSTPPYAADNMNMRKPAFFPDSLERFPPYPGRFFQEVGSLLRKNPFQQLLCYHVQSFDTKIQLLFIQLNDLTNNYSLE